jgi:hypothetical protein
MQFFDLEALGRNLKMLGEKPQDAYKVQIFDYNIFLPFLNL